MVVAEVCPALGLFFRLIVSDWSPYGDGATMTTCGAVVVFCRLVAAAVEV